jgi:hypothetical protein
VDLRELGRGSEKMEMGAMTEHAKNLLVVVVIAGWAVLVVADWYGYVKDPYVTLLQATVNPPAAAVRAGFMLYKPYSQHHY